MQWKHSAFAAAMMLSMAGVAQADPIYLAPADNGNQIGFSGPGGAWSVGNTITIASPVNYLKSVDLSGYAGGGSKPIQVDLYAGADPNIGTLLGSGTVTPTGNGYTTEIVDFSTLNLLLPQTLTYIISIVGNNGSYGDSFVDWQQFTGNGSAPTIGTNGDMWYGSGPGSFVADNSYATATGAQSNTLGVQFDVPEPATWTIMLVGLGALGLMMRSRRKASAASA